MNNPAQNASQGKTAVSSQEQVAMPRELIQNVMNFIAQLPHKDVYLLEAELGKYLNAPALSSPEPSSEDTGGK